jgi:hypothetical protein
MTSNLTFDVDALAKEMKAHSKRFKTSFHTYHPKFIAPEKWLEQAERLRDSGLVAAPTFSMVNLQRFPHVRDDEHDRNVQQLVELADRRGLLYQFNEFRGTHMGDAFTRGDKNDIECTSAWVNIDPEGAIYNCQYHLTERKNAFGNITAIDACRPLLQMGEFFSCSDFGYCDPCHENSGHGAFRDGDGKVFRRTADDTRIYLQWMEPAAVAEVGRRYMREGRVDEARHAFLAAIGRDQQAGAPGEAQVGHETWADLGMTLWEAGEKDRALASLMHAMELGSQDLEVTAAIVELGRETGRRDEVVRVLGGYLPAERIVEIERAVEKSFV